MYSVSASKIKRKTKKKNNEFCIFEKQTNFKRWMYKSISFQSVELAYQIDGKGPAIVLVHGFCEDSSIWDFYTRRWQNQFLVLRLDLPGFGKSQILSNWTFEEVADALNQILLQENISACYLIGHSKIKRRSAFRLNQKSFTNTGKGFRGRKSGHVGKKRQS